MAFFVFYLNFYIKSVYNIINYSFISVLFFVECIFLKIILKLKTLKENNLLRKAMPQLDIAIIKIILITLIVFLVLGYIYSIVIINRAFFVIQIRNFFIIKFELDILKSIENILVKENYSKFLNNLSLTVLGEYLKENFLLNYLIFFLKLNIVLNINNYYLTKDFFIKD